MKGEIIQFWYDTAGGPKRAKIHLTLSIMHPAPKHHEAKYDIDGHLDHAE